MLEFYIIFHCFASAITWDADLQSAFYFVFFFNSFTSSVMSCMRITTYKLCMKNACCHNKIIQRCLKENFWLASVRVSSDTSAESLNVFSEGNCLQCMM